MWLNQSLTLRTASEVMPLSYHGTRSDQLALSCSSRKICRSLDSRMIGWAAITGDEDGQMLRLASIAALVGSSFATSVFCGRDGTMMRPWLPGAASAATRSRYTCASRTHRRCVPDRVLQYVTLYSTCLLIPSPPVRVRHLGRRSQSPRPQAGTLTSTGAGRTPTSMLTAGGFEGGAAAADSASTLMAGESSRRARYCPWAFPEAPPSLKLDKRAPSHHSFRESSSGEFDTLAGSPRSESALRAARATGISHVSEGSKASVRSRARRSQTGHNAGTRPAQAGKEEREQ